MTYYKSALKREAKAEIIETMWMNGMNPKEIADALGHPIGYIYKYVSIRDLKLKKLKQKFLKMGLNEVN
ncbi:MAG TPA: hypothetical protein VFU05_02805 [Cyclobacteriaceae bacterium]|nr:hypothetical protein [Cyclobacteriaceae bacterium]